MQQFYVGVVESRDDPLNAGRVQVRVFGVHSESTSLVPTSSLPWAIPLMPGNRASMSGIGSTGAKYLPGSSVFLFFQDGESMQQPIILGGFEGIPIRQDPLATGVDSIVEPTPIPSNVVVSSSGTPVVSSDGTPVTTEGSCCGDLDTSRAVRSYGTNVTLVCSALCSAGIKNPFAVIAILSNVIKESGFKLVRENMNYSSVSRLRQIFPSKFGSMSDELAQGYVNNAEALANLVYGSRYGNGPEPSGDGYRYRGGGFIQLTFKSNYSKIGSQLGVDLVGSPELINTPEVAAKVVAQFMINAAGGLGRLNFQDLDSALTGVTKMINPGGFSNDIGKVRTNSGLFATSTVLAPPENTGSTDPSNTIDPTVTREQINSGATVPSGSSTGFRDPSGKYPLKNLLREPDVNRLARRSTKGTLIEKRTQNRRVGIESISRTFSEPDTAYNSQYPLNDVFQSESGHVMEFDDTPGAERINLWHRTGTFTEIDPNGTRTNKIVGDDFSIIERNGYVFINGTARVTIGGNCELVVGGNMSTRVDGNWDIDIGGSMTTRVAGTHQIHSGGDSALDAPNIHLNSGMASGLGISGRGASGQDFSPIVVENYKDSVVYDFDDSDENSVRAAQSAAIANGEMTQNEIDAGAAAKPTETSDEKPPETIEALPASCDLFRGLTSIPSKTQISRWFNIGMLSSGAVVSRYEIVPQHGLSVAEIACNLKGLAENCLDRIRDKYPDMRVTSGFRRGSGTSQHERGFAADMQFSQASTSDYFEIAKWIRDNVLFDNLLLEYKTTGTKLPWIHISYTPSPRKQVFTYMNDRKAGTGLQKLQ